MSTNPYKSPNVETLHALVGGDEQRIAVRTAPHDVIDILIGVLHALLLLFVPSVIAFLATNSLLVAGALSAASYLLVLGFTVWSVRVSEHGIRFVRLLGSPKLIQWRNITSIEDASRSEVILRGWFEPRFPFREMTTCMSALGHLRISWSGGWCYFPPKDVAQFRKIAGRYQPRNAT